MRLSTIEAAEVAGVTPSAVRAAYMRGTLQGTKTGRDLFFTLGQIRAWRHKANKRRRRHV